MTSRGIELEHLRQWVGRTTEQTQVIDPFPAQAFAALLEHDLAPAAGTALPLPWHWLYFLETPKRSELGADGHPLRGGFLPPVPLPRRMWAAGRMECDQPLTLGESARKVSRIAKVDLKEGKSGALVFVTIVHELFQGAVRCVHETQDLVYRAAPEKAVTLPPGEPAPEEPMWSQAFRADGALLFRFSALTYNGHRIHYDRDYAREVEFYPDLVVHGPLLASFLLDFATQCRSGARVTRFEFRAQRPAFQGATLRLCANPEGGGLRLWTQDDQGFIGMQAFAAFS